MNTEILKWINEIHNVSKQVDLNNSIVEIIKQNFKLDQFTLLNYDVANYAYNIVFSTETSESDSDIFFFEAEMEADTPFILMFEDKEITVYNKEEINTDDGKYVFLIHNRFENTDIKKLRLILLNYLTAYKNRILLQYYQTSLISNQYQLDILNELGDMLGSFKLDVVLAKLLENVNNIVNSDVGIIFLYDKKSEKLKSKINWGVKEDIILEIIDVNSGKSVIEETFETKQMKFYEDIKNSPDISYPSDKIFLTSLLTFPVFTNNENLGVISLFNFDLDESFVDTKLITLETIVKIAAIGIENSIFFEKSIEQEKVNTQLKIAADIQNNLLPKDDLIYNGINITGFSTPAMNIGGDFYNYMIDGKKIYAFLGDVAGKGIPAALLTTMAMIVIKTSITSDKNIEDIVFRINNIISEESLGDSYFTLGIFDIDTESDKLKYVACSQEVLYYSKLKNELINIESTNLPVGMFDNVEYFFEELEFKEGDMFFTFSDGITDAVNPEGEDYGLEKLKKVILANVDKNAVDIKNAILKDIEIFSKDTPQFDDLTIMVIKKS